MAPPLWAGEQPAPGSQAGSVPGRHAPVSQSSPALLCPSSGRAGGPRWVGARGQGEQGRAVLPDPGSHGRPPVGASHRGRGLLGWRWRQITLFPRWLLPISVAAAAGRQDRTPSMPYWGAVRKGSRLPSPLSQPRGGLFLHELFSFRLDAVPRGSERRTRAPTPHFLAIKQQSRGRSGAPGWGSGSAGQGTRCSVVPPCAQPHRPPLDRHPPAVPAPLLPFLRAGSGVLGAGAACPCAGGSRRGGHHPSLGMMPPSDGCNRAPQSFCRGFCASALPPRPQADPEEAEPCSSAAFPRPQSRQALPAHPKRGPPPATAHPSRAAHARGAPAMCVLNTTVARALQPIHPAGRGIRDGSSPPDLWHHWDFVWSITGVPPAPTGHPVARCSAPQTRGQRWQPARPS